MDVLIINDILRNDELVTILTFIRNVKIWKITRFLLNFQQSKTEILEKFVLVSIFGTLN